MMIVLANYRIINKVYESEHSLIYRAQDKHQKVILKVLKAEYPPVVELNRYKHEYALARSLNHVHQHVVKAYRLEKHENTAILVLEDFGGAALKHWLMQRRFNLIETLVVALKIVESLATIHANHIVHKDINPTNIIFNPISHQLKITDFGIATLLPQETPALKSLAKLEGTLAYISPEQTGRIQRVIDYRTDFYALGVTLYELMTQRLPFETQDSLELVHCHLAKQPLLPHLINPEIPTIISGIIMKLLEKNAEARYQSIWGLKADLEHCLGQLKTEGQIQLFPLGQYDIANQFQIPQKIYGRQPELNHLLTSLERVQRGHTEITLLSGHAGNGKTSLVNELYQPILAHQQGYFIRGQFTPQGEPYSAFIQAFQDFIHQRLAESESPLNLWRQQLLTAFNHHSALLIQTIPDMALILGPTHAASKPTEQMPSNHWLWLTLLRLSAQAQHPLVIFLDNLQFSDEASLQLIAGIHNIPYLFLISAYSQMTPALQQTLKHMQARPLNQLTLGPLRLPYVHQLITDTFKMPLDKTQELAEVVLMKTQGNPFFIKEFLTTLYADNLIKFVPPQRSATWGQHAIEMSVSEPLAGHWQWNIDNIQKRPITANVVTLLADKIQRLKPACQHLLKSGACLGYHFNLNLLALINQQPLQLLNQDLRQAIAQGLVIAVDEQDNYQFAHERIQQALYSLIPQKADYHEHIGQQLLQQLPHEQTEAHFLLVVNQFNLGNAASLTPLQLALLNILAARHTKSQQLALHYFQQALVHLSPQTDLQWHITLEAAEVAYQCAEFSQFDQFIEQALTQIKTLQDKIKIYALKLKALQAQNQFKALLDTALMVLKWLGVHLPAQPQPRHRRLAMLQVNGQLKFIELKAKLNGYSLTTWLLNQPAMQDPQALITIEILTHLYTASYKARPALFPLVVAKQIQLSLQYGNATESALAYASYGFLSYIFERKVQKCDHFSQLALKLAWSNHQQTQVVMLIHTHIKPWQVHLKTVLSALLKTCQHHLSTCQQPLTVMCAYTYCSSAYLLGHELSEQEKKIHFYDELLSSNAHRLPLYHLFHQVVLNLLGHSSTPTQLKGRYFDETTMLTQLFQSHDNSALALFYLNKLILYYLFNDHQQAVNHAILTEKYLDSLQGTWFIPLFYFYAALARLGFYTTLTFNHTLSQYAYHQGLLKQVRGYQKKLQRWAQDAPMNYAHKYALLQAEYERIKGRYHHARNHYHQAIALAQQNDYLNEEALAYELTAQFYLNIKEQQLAHYYLRNAHHAYQRWGATAKVDALESYYTEMFWHTSLSPPTINYINTLNTLSSSTTDISQLLDLNSIFKAQQTIASEIVLDKLLVKLMKIVIETAGAQRGSLLLNQQGQWFIEAQSTQHNQEIKVLQAIPLTPLSHLPTTASEEMLPLGSDEWAQNSMLSTTQPLNSHQIPLSVIHYVIRTQTSVVLPNATQDNQFQADPYIIKQQAKSVLCLPLIHQNKLIAILYLENNLAPGVFTAARLQVLNLLSSHIAIAIDKAQSYAKTQALNTQLRESEERFRVIAETTPTPLIINRFIDGGLLYANAQAILYLGLKKPLQHYKINDFLDEQQLLELFQYRAPIQNYEIHLKNTAYSNVWIALSSYPIHYNNEKVLLSVLYDITERKQAEEERLRFTKALSESEERFRIIAETTPIPLVIFNAQHGLILYANARIDTILGLPAAELVHQHYIEEFFDTRCEYQRLLTQLAQEGCVRNYELKLKKNDNSIVYAEISIQPLIFKDEQVLFGAIYDITARKHIEEERIRFIQEREAKNAALQLNAQLQQEISERLCAEAALEKANQELSRLATLDSLTQLANRRRLDEYLAAEWQRLMREQAPLSFIICDIDYFKGYNDTYGHQTGDDCLQQVAQAMSRAVKRPADLLARYGGEEFAAILPYTDAEGAILVASAMRWEVKLLKIPHRFSTVTEYVTLSMGVSSVIPQRHLAPRSLVSAADNALYEAKAQGRNRIILKSL